MDSTQIQAQIDGEYAKLVARADNLQINRSAIPNLIQTWCKDAERHTGLHWRHFMPEEIKNEL